MHNLVVIKNKFGFFELQDKPLKDELNQYYVEKYYQEGKGGYQTEYSKEEIEYINNKLTQKYEIITSLNKQLEQQQDKRLLDIGCGEGWALNYFKKKSWNVIGLDYSNYGCKKHNPECVDYLQVGDIYKSINKLIVLNKKFDLVILDNVLEHVINPEKLLLKIKKIIKNSGILVVDVPNDFSVVQRHLFQKEYLAEEFWIAVPDHISYFDKDGLSRLAKHCGWESRKIISDFPIDFNLFNKNTNYVLNKSVGKSCHIARIEIENLLHHISVVKTNDFYEAAAELGIGRELICFLSKAAIN